MKNQTSKLKISKKNKNRTAIIIATLLMALGFGTLGVVIGSVLTSQSQPTQPMQIPNCNLTTVNTSNTTPIFGTTLPMESNCKIVLNGGTTPETIYMYFDIIPANAPN